MLLEERERLHEMLTEERKELKHMLEELRKCLSEAKGTHFPGKQPTPTDWGFPKS